MSQAWHRGIVHLPSQQTWLPRKGHRELGHAAQNVRVARPSLPGHSGDCVSRQRNSTLLSSLNLHQFVVSLDHVFSFKAM